MGIPHLTAAQEDALDLLRSFPAWRCYRSRRTAWRDWAPTVHARTAMSLEDMGLITSRPIRVGRRYTRYQLALGRRRPR
jgi:hypothetical protein